MNEPSVDLQRFIDARDAGEGKAAMIADAVCEKYKLIHRIIFHPDEPTFPFTDEEMPYLIIAMMLLEEETRRVFYEAANEADRMFVNITRHLITEKEDKMNYKNCECTTDDMTPEMNDEEVRNPSMMEKVAKIGGIATDVGALAYRLYVHMFGQPCLSEEKRNKKEATCLDDDIENIMRLLLEAGDVLNEACNKIGC